MSDIATAAIVDPEVLTRQARDAGLIVQRANPLNAEAPMSALNGAEITPNAKFYVRNHFPVPALDAAGWQLSVTGSVKHLLTFRLHDLDAMRSVRQVVTLEYAGNNRMAFQGQAPGPQWRLGAVSTAEWTGVPLVEILDRAKPTPSAREVLVRDCGPGGWTVSDRLLRAQPQPRRHRRQQCSAGLRDERCAAAKPALLSAAAHRAGMVPGGVGQVADRDRRHRPRLRRILPDRAVPLHRVAGWRTELAGTPPASKNAHHRTCCRPGD